MITRLVLRFLESNWQEARLLWIYLRSYNWGNWSVALEFKLPDLWRGIFPRFKYNKSHLDFPLYWRFELWIVIVPCFPVHITIERSRAWEKFSGG